VWLYVCFLSTFVAFGFLHLLCSCDIYCLLVWFVLSSFLSFLLPWLLDRCWCGLLGSL
jgi:hypothetical protein